MGILKLKKVPLIIFLVLIFMPLIGGAGIFIENQFNLGSDIIFFLMLIPIFITSYLIFPLISPLFNLVGIHLGDTGLFSGGPTVAGWIIVVILHIAFSFLIAKLINFFFFKSRPVAKSIQ